MSTGCKRSRIHNIAHFETGSGTWSAHFSRRAHLGNYSHRCPNKSFSQAVLTPIGPLDFASGATTLDFAALPTGTEANGLILDTVLFQVTKNSVATNGIVVVDGGPGTTGNIMPPNLVSLSDPNGVALIVSLPHLASQFGYGYAINAGVSVTAATTIELFAGATPLGSISFTGIPDPIFTWGFAGVASDTPFDRAVLTFSDVGDAFAVDNVTFSANKASDEGLSHRLFIHRLRLYLLVA